MIFRGEGPNRVTQENPKPLRFRSLSSRNTSRVYRELLIGTSRIAIGSQNNSLDLPVKYKIQRVPTSGASGGKPQLPAPPKDVVTLKVLGNLPFQLWRTRRSIRFSPTSASLTTTLTT